MRHLDFPNNIQIETTSYCNASCGFCPYPETSQTEPQGVMDDELFRSIVEQISRHPVMLIQPFLNNDPLTDRKIIQRLDLIIEKNPQARVSITTNGVLLKDEIARELARMDLETIHISSNALTPEVYRETMGIDAYAVIRNVNNLWDLLRRRNSPTKLVVTAILLKANKHEMAHMRDYWRSRGVEFYLNPLNNRAGNIDAGKFVQLLPFEDSINRSQFRSYNMSGCPALYSFMGILWNGDLITCCMDWRRSQVLGNAREDTLHNLWRGPAYGRMRDLSNAGQLDQFELCRECGDNKFSIDLPSLEGLLARQREYEASADDRELLSFVRDVQQREPESIKLGLVRDAAARMD